MSDPTAGAKMKSMSPSVDKIKTKFSNNINCVYTLVFPTKICIFAVRLTIMVWVVYSKM